MNDDLQSALASNFNDLAAWVKSAAGASGDFIAREAPLFVQEYVAWVFWSSTLTAILLALLVLLALGIAIFFFFAEYIEGGVVFCIGALILTGFAISNANTAIKAKVAPRVLIVEKISEIAGMKK